MTQYRTFEGQPSIDQFGRLRVSEPQTLYDAKQLFDNLPLLWDEETYQGGATSYSSVNAATTLSTTEDGDAAIRQTFARFNYQPGKSQLVVMTFLATQETGVRKRIGYFESSNAANSVPQNGIYFEVNGDSISWNIAKNGTVTETAAKSDWNVSQIPELDLDGVQISFLAFEWLGVGTVAVGFVVDGEFVVCHVFRHSNEGFKTVYMSTPNLPLNYSIYQTGEHGGSMDCICATVISEGGSEVVGINRAADMGATTVTAAATDTLYALIGIRLKASHAGATVTLSAASAIATSANDSFMVGLALNPTVASTFTYSDLANSCVQTATGVAANTLTGGTVLFSRYVSASSRELNIDANALPRLGRAIDGTMDQLVLFARPVGGSTDVIASLNWIEQV